MKSTKERIAECTNIRKQLSSLGILSVPKVAETLRTHMNDYVTYGTSQTFTIRDADTLRGNSIKIILTSNEHKQSGITLIK
jgi:hypothetical protein